MESDSIIKIIILVILLMFSAFFAATETAFSSMNRIRIKNMAGMGNKKAALVLRLSENYDRLLSTVLIANNIVNIATTAIATVLFFEILKDQEAAATVSTIVVTVAVLIFGEITPKSIAKDSPEKYVMFAAPFLRIFIYLLYPLNLFFAGWKKLVSLVIKPNDDKGITEEELLTIVEEAENEGDMESNEVELIRNAIEFNDIEVIDILQPRVDVVAVDAEMSWEEIEKTFRESGYSRLPVYNDKIDNIIGIVNQKDFFMSKTKNLCNIMKPIDFVVPNMKISQLMVLLQKNKSHMAAVVDEYGGILGIITLEDIIEELVGEIWDEHDEIVEEFEKISDNEYRVLCSASLDDLFERFGINKELDIPTVSGWVIEELKHIPEVGDTFEYENLTVTVTACDSRHVLEITVKVNVSDEGNDT